MAEAIWGAHVLDTNVAPRLSTFSAATIRDMSRADSQQEHWSANYLLNTVLRTRLKTPYRQQVTNSLRHTQSAFSSYAFAREATGEYLIDRNRPMLYLRAVGHWEDFLAHAWLAYNFINRGQRDLFKKRDGSVLQRLYDLNARARHAAEAIERGDIADEAPVTVWLQNSGLHSTTDSLTFDECAELLVDLAQLASAMQDPGTVRDRLEQLVAESQARERGEA